FGVAVLGLVVNVRFVTQIRKTTGKPDKQGMIKKQETKTVVGENGCDIGELKKEKINTEGDSNSRTQNRNLPQTKKNQQKHINKIRSYESDKKIKNERIIHLQEKETRITAELNHDRNQLEHVQYTIKRLNEELFEEQGKLDVFGLDIDRKQTEVEELRGQQSS